MTDTEVTHERARSGTQAIDRAVDVLRLLEARGGAGDLGITAIAEGCGLSVSTAHRIVKALGAAGFVAQDPATDRYHLGPALVGLGHRAQARLGLDRWHAVLEQLARDTGESASLGTRVGNEVLIADHVPSAQPLRFDAGTGSRVPIHASAMGKMLLAWSDDPAGDVAALGALETFTDRTRADPRRLLDELALIRRRGWSLNDGERNAGVRAIAVAIPATHGPPTAAIAVQGPEVRLTDDTVESVAATLTAAVRSVSSNAS